MRIRYGQFERTGRIRARSARLHWQCLRDRNITAPTSLAFLNERLGAERIRFESEDALAAALHAGTIDAASMNLPSLIEGLDRGCRVRVAAGLHPAA